MIYKKFYNDLLVAVQKLGLVTLRYFISLIREMFLFHFRVYRDLLISSIVAFRSRASGRRYSLEFS